MAEDTRPTGVLAMADGTIVYGYGFGAEGSAVGEVCFNTAMTGYQEVMTDPSYAAQIVAFTFPHIGNVGANREDEESGNPHAVGCVVREAVTRESNWRARGGWADWMRVNGRIGLSGVDTRALTRRIRELGAPNAVIAHSAAGAFDVDALVAQARAWSGLEGLDLAKQVSTLQTYKWNEGSWSSPHSSSKPEQASSQRKLGPHEMEGDASTNRGPSVRWDDEDGKDRPRVVAIDYGLKRNILRNLIDAGADVTVVPATATFDDIMAHSPAGLFLSNGPGDPAATGEYAVPVIREWLATGKPTFGICLGHQLLGLAIGATTSKMHQGHRGANHPVKRTSDGRVEITSMNHGFAVDRDSLPSNARETHVSLFDGSNAGFELTDAPAFSVQYHPEASPGPQDSRYLFERFVGELR